MFPETTTELSVPPRETTQQHASNHRRFGSGATVPDRSSLSAGNDLRQMVSAKPQMMKMERKKSWMLFDYYSGPLDPTRHSRLPFWMRLHGSIVPKLIIPVVFVGGWATMITCISKFVYPLIVDSVLLTVLGFVVGLALSFRVSTANDRYAEGRRYWSQIVQNGRMLGHNIWIHAKERPGEEKTDLLDKLAAINLIHSFTVAVKDKLRHKVVYDDVELAHLNINNLDTFSKKIQPAVRKWKEERKEKSAGQRLKRIGAILGIPFMTDNPRKAEKEAQGHQMHVGNLPYEILNYLGFYMEANFRNGTLPDGPIQGNIYSCLNALMDAYCGCERVLETPLPLAYNIAISQITWLYVLVLPFQLYKLLDWLVIPGTTVAAFVILGLAAIGRELEDPFGTDVNDLNLEHYCTCLEYDLHVLTSQRPSRPENFFRNGLTKPLYPASSSSYNTWKARSISEIHDRLAMKPTHRYKGFDQVFPTSSGFLEKSEEGSDAA